ncbi:hypothetical protein [Roseateles puraquae]|uniref:hypothetical protein n=1 Tax=Roseateles puraquae TaxID=431059 RepID=UPI0031D435D3
MSQSDQYQPVEDAFREGRVNAEDTATLNAYLMALSNQSIPNDGVRHRDIIRGLTINHILMQRHIAELDRKNSFTQRLVLALTVASLLVGGIQIWYALRADERAEQEERLKASVAQSKDQAKVLPAVEIAQPLVPASQAKQAASTSGAKK